MPEGTRPRLLFHGITRKQWLYISAMCVALVAVREVSAIAYDYITGHQKKVDEAAFAFQWATIAHDSIPVFSRRFERIKGKVRTDSARIDKLEKRR